MATKYLSANASSLASSVWWTTSGGTTTTSQPTTGDTAELNNHTLTMAASETWTTGTIQNTAGGSVVATANGITINAHINAIGTTALTVSPTTGNSVTVNGTVTNATATGAIAFASNGTFNYTGSCTAGSSSVGIGIYVSGGSGTLNINGTSSLIGGTNTSACGVYFSGTGTVNLAGTVTCTGGSTSSAYGIYNSTTGTVNTSGTATFTGGTVTGAYGAYNGSTGSFTLSGSGVSTAIGNGYGNGSTGLTPCVGFYNSLTGSCTITNAQYGALGMSPTFGPVTVTNSTPYTPANGVWSTSAVSALTTFASSLDPSGRVRVATIYNIFAGADWYLSQSAGGIVFDDGDGGYDMPFNTNIVEINQQPVTATSAITVKPNVGFTTAPLQESDGTVKSSLTKILNTALTETTTGNIQATFKKFHDISSPTNTANTLATASALSSAETALTNSINAIDNLSARSGPKIPATFVVPASGTNVYTFYLYLWDLDGVSQAPDAAPTVHAKDPSGNSLDSHLNSTTMTLVSTGIYSGTYTVNSTDTQIEAFFTFAWLVSSVAMADAGAVTITTVDELSNVAAIKAQTDKLTFDGSNYIKSDPQTGVTVASGGINGNSLSTGALVDIAASVATVSSLNTFSPGTLAYQVGLIGTNADTVTVSSSSISGIVTSLLDTASTVESLTLRQTLEGIAAVLLGTTSGAGTSTETFNSAGGSTPRVSATNDGKNRTEVTLTL